MAQADAKVGNSVGLGVSRPWSKNCSTARTTHAGENPCRRFHATVTQLAESQPSKLLVEGSNPFGRSKTTQSPSVSVGFLPPRQR